MPLTYGIEEEHEQLSVDVVELNNVLLSMRPLIKRGKVLLVRELASYIKRQKAKQSKAPERKTKRLGRKIINRLAELRLLKSFNTTKLCKIVLANENSHDILEKGGENLTKQDRIVIRLASRPEIAKFVNTFRASHTDWHALVHYLLYKNTSGKWKTTKQKRKVKKHRKGDLPFPVLQSEFTGDNQNASTITQFKEFKEAHDLQLIDAQRRLLDEDSVEQGDGVEELHHPRCDNLEMKAFISELLQQAEKGEEIDESLFLEPCGGESVGCSDAVEKIPEPERSEVTSMIQRSKQMKSRTSTTHRSRRSSGRPENHDGTIGTMEESAAGTPNASRRTPQVLKSRGEQDATPNAPEGSVIAGMDDGVVVEQTLRSDLIEEEGHEETVDESILGRDDVEMKRELRERKARSGNRGTYRQGVRPRQQGGSKQFPRGFKNHSTAARDEPKAPMHPSWVAKREEKARLTISGRAPPTGSRIVFSDE